MENFTNFERMQRCPLPTLKANFRLWIDPPCAPSNDRLENEKMSWSKIRCLEFRSVSCVAGMQQVSFNALKEGKTLLIMIGGGEAAWVP